MEHKKRPSKRSGGGGGGHISVCVSTEMAHMPTLYCLRRGIDTDRRRREPNTSWHSFEKNPAIPLQEGVVHQMGCTLRRKTRQDKTRHDTTRQDKAQDKTRQDTAKQEKTKHHKVNREGTKLLLFCSERVRIHQVQFYPASEAGRGGRLGVLMGLFP